MLGNNALRQSGAVERWVSHAITIAMDRWSPLIEPLAHR